MTLATTDHARHGTSTESADRWQDHAACKDLDDRLLFPEDIRPQKRQRQTVRFVFEARCRHCPVAELCLAEAEALPERYGIRGGYSAAERGWPKR